MEIKKTKEEAVKWFRQAIEKKRAWKKELEEEYALKGEKVNVVFL